MTSVGRDWLGLYGGLMGLEETLIVAIFLGLRVNRESNWDGALDFAPVLHAVQGVLYLVVV